MKYSEQQLDDIRKYAENLTRISDIAVLMQLDERTLREDIADSENPASVVYRVGKATTSLRIRQNELQLADAGSPLAVQLMSNYIHEMDADEDL